MDQPGRRTLETQVTRKGETMTKTTTTYAIPPEPVPDWPTAPYVVWGEDVLRGGGPMMRMTRDEQIAAVMASPIPICPCCEHGMDPHGVDPGGICGVGGCECLLTPSTIHWLLNLAQGVAR